MDAGRSTPRTGSIPFVGRDAERERFAAAARGAAAGHPWLVVIEGQAGSGKSALLRTCLDDLGDGFVVERAFADELAMDVPMGLLGQVVAVTDDPPFTAALRLIDHLAELQQGGTTVVLAIEDLHWGDQPSLLALVTALRRLEHDHVLVVVTERQDAPVADERWARLRADPDRSRRIPVPPLTAQECAELASAGGTSLPPDAAERLVRHTAGNALYVRTILEELTPSQLLAAGPTLPVPRSLGSMVAAQVAAMPADAAALCEALAVLGGRAPVAVAEAVSGVPDVLAVLERAGAGSLIEVSTGPGRPEVAFAHPLQELAIYDDLAPVRRRELHTAAASVLAGEDSLRHRAMADDPADSTLEDDLVAAAGRATTAGSTAAAVRYLLWARDVADRDEVRGRRQLEASRALMASGQLGRAEELCPASVADEDRQLLDLVRGVLAAASGDTSTGERLLRDAGAGADAEVAASALVQLGYLFTAQARGADAVQALEPVSRLLDPDAEEAQVAGVLHAIGVSQQRGARAGLADLARRFPDDRHLTASIEVLVGGARGMLELYGGQKRAATASLRWFLERAHQGYQTAHVPRVEMLLAQALVAGGMWDEAAVHARTAIDLATDAGAVLVLAQAQAVAAMALAPGAASASASGYAVQARRTASAAGTSEADVWARLAAASVAEAVGEPDQVVAVLRPLESGQRDDAAPMFAALWLPRLADALLDLHRTAEATDRVDTVVTLARERSAELEVVAAALRGRLAARGGDRAGALRQFELAEAAVTPDTPVLDRFQLHRHHGEELLAAGRLEEARSQLRAAEELVAPLGSGPLLDRVRTELEAAGDESVLTPAVATTGLTERERDVVALVRRGYTNREVAEALFVSVKAVEYHMGNIFSKLGIRSRRELRAPLR